MKVKKKKNSTSGDNKYSHYSSLDIRMMISRMSITEKIELAKKTRDPRILNILARDRNDAVRLEVAKNKGDNSSILHMLAHDEMMNVRVNAFQTMREKMLLENDERNSAFERMLYFIDSDKSNGIDRDNFISLYVGNSDDFEKSLHRFKNEVKENYKGNEWIGEMAKVLLEGILIGEMLNGDWESYMDLQVALLTGRDLDGIDIPNDTPEERNPIDMSDADLGVAERREKNKSLVLDR